MNFQLFNMTYKALAFPAPFVTRLQPLLTAMQFNGTTHGSPKGLYFPLPLQQCFCWYILLASPYPPTPTLSLPWIPNAGFTVPLIFLQHPNLYLFYIILAVQLTAFHIWTQLQKAKDYEIFTIISLVPLNSICWINDLPCCSQKSHALWPS